jgi:pimeloyl-ACP methyl ester carboxylesterase
MMRFKKVFGYWVFYLIVALFFLNGCGGGGGSETTMKEEARPQDTRVFTINTDSLPFAVLSGTTTETDRWTGTLGGSGYRIEVPKIWNGMLVMYAHGYAGTSASLTVTTPSGIRRFLIENGYAWAASSYDKNYYDVRSGVEETNALALAFGTIAAANGRPLAPPSKIYITGHSMGGHIAAAAIEDETYATAKNKVRYNGAVLMCGVVGDMKLFDYFVSAQRAAQQIAGYPAVSYPAKDFELIGQNVQHALFTTFPAPPFYPAAVTTPKGDTFKGIMMNLTGGKRPMFDQGFSGPYLGMVWGTFGGDGTISGIINRQGTDTNSIIYQFDDNPLLSVDEYAFNVSIVRATEDANANRLRRDGLRWIPVVNGQFKIPVVSLHTLGDMYVPFMMQQVYRKRADAGSGKDWLVQRAIRGVAHCDFTSAEQVAALKAMLDWEQTGLKPAGDNVLTPATVAAANYGCQFTINTTGPDDALFIGLIRASLPVCP